MANLALNKIATASSFVLPYEPARAIEGTGDKPIRRWLSIKLPCNMDVDLGANYCINRWVVKHMENAGWSSGYNMTDYKLQGSLDSKTWSDIDTVTGNSSKITDRTFKPVTFRYVRFYADKGIRVNPKLVSIMELEIYQAPASQYLSNLQLSVGTLNPVFAGKTTFSYTANVAYDVTSITLTPTAEDSAAKITVNGTSVTSGSASTPINLNVGANTITVVVTASDNSASQTYTVTVTRVAALTGINAIVVGGATIPLTPSPFDKTKLSYVGTIEYSNASFGTQNVEITPTADAGVLIKYNGSAINSGTAVTITPNVGDTTVKFDVSAADGSGMVTYEVKITRKHSTYLGLNGIKTSKGTVAPSQLTKGPSFTYGVKTVLSNTTTLTFTAEDPSSTITLTLDSSTTSAVGTISRDVAQISATAKTATVVVSSSYGVSSTTYTVNVSR